MSIPDTSVCSVDAADLSANRNAFNNSFSATRFARRSDDDEDNDPDYHPGDAAADEFGDFADMFFPSSSSSSTSSMSPPAGLLASAMRMSRLLGAPPPPPPNQRSYARDSTVSGRTSGEALEIEDSDDEGGSGAGEGGETVLPKSSVVRVGGRDVVEIEER